MNVGPSFYRLFFAMSFMVTFSLAQAEQGQHGAKEDVDAQDGEVSAQSAAQEENKKKRRSKEPVHHHEPAELFISGPLGPQPLSRITRAVSVLDSEELVKHGSGGIGDLLASVPGVNSSSFGPGASRPIIRGQRGDRVRVLGNGLSLGDLSALSDDHAVGADPLLAEGIEVLRGPETLRFGGGAIGGVVNILDNAIPEKNIEQDLQGRLDIRKGDSADEETSGAAVLEGGMGKWNWHLASQYHETDDIEIPGDARAFPEKMHDEEIHGEEEHEHEEHEAERGTLENSDTLRHGFRTGFSRSFDDGGFVGASVEHFQTRYGVPGHMHPEDLNHEHLDKHEEEEAPVKVDLDQWRYSVRGLNTFQNSFFDSLRYGLSVFDYAHKEKEGSTVATRFKNDGLEFRSELGHQALGNWKGALGTQIHFTETAISGEEAYLPNNDVVSPALFLFERYRISPILDWDIGGRYEYNRVRAQDQDTLSEQPLSFSTGPSWHTEDDEYSFGVNYSYTERAPTPAELFADGAHLATRSFEIGNTNLRKESSHGLEAVLRKNKGRVTTALSSFYQNFNDYIALLPTGDVAEGLDVYTYSPADVYFWGFEAESTVHLLEGFEHRAHITGQIDYVRARNPDDKENLPRIPPLQGRLILGYGYHEFEGALEGVFAASQDDLAQNETPTAGYGLINLDLSYDMPSSPLDLELYLRGENLGDQEARLHTSFLKDYAPLRGRAFFFGLRGFF